RGCSGKVIGIEDVANMAHALIVEAFLRAYPDDPLSRFYVEVAITTTRQRPADLVVVHRDLGVLLVESKSFGLEIVTGVEAGRFLVQRKGEPIKEENPLGQVEAAMHQMG